MEIGIVMIPHLGFPSFCSAIIELAMNNPEKTRNSQEYDLSCLSLIVIFKVLYGVTHATLLAKKRASLQSEIKTQS